ncbi:hypothetical protein ACIRNI_03670 [Streptomyces sp. NPDC093546]|uniref:hypothetical protein n=1 Tax=Streptomyces sp. NPDC093546 TaxID=3366040 RepID=UPI00381E77A8
MNLRTIGIGAVVVFAASLPLAASAGPAGSPGPGPDFSHSSAHGGAAVRGATARCGPELVSPDGVEAQTCVLAEGRETWARTYYRNATGGELAAVLALMGPGGRTLQTHCAVPADDEPGACETPRAPRRGMPGEYAAVAEFAASGDAETSPLLLRSGSAMANSPARSAG